MRDMRPIDDQPTMVGGRPLIYMDHAATTPVRPEVLEAMLPYFSQHYGNPSSLYPLADESKKAIDRARRQVADVLGCRRSEVVFTSGGTESDNTAIKGVAMAMRDHGNHIITSNIEHHAVLDTCRDLERQGFDVTYLPVDSDGLVDPDDVGRAITSRTTLVSLMYANNEIGTIQPINEISCVIRGRERELGRPVVFHTDAVQAAQFLELDVSQLGVDLMSLSAHKFHGPKGIGILYVQSDTPLVPLHFGGGQERGIRSGTENVPGIVGAGHALSLAARERAATSQHCIRLRDRLIRGISEETDGCRINGHLVCRLPNNASFTFDQIDGEAMVLALGVAGIAASTGSACTTGAVEPSHVILALGVARERAWGSLRLTLGPENTEAEVEWVIHALSNVVQNISDIRESGVTVS